MNQKIKYVTRCDGRYRRQDIRETDKRLKSEDSVQKISGEAGHNTPSLQLMLLHN